VIFLFCFFVFWVGGGESALGGNVICKKPSPWVYRMSPAIADDLHEPPPSRLGHFEEPICLDMLFRCAYVSTHRGDYDGDPERSCITVHPMNHQQQVGGLLHMGESKNHSSAAMQHQPDVRCSTRRLGTEWETAEGWHDELVCTSRGRVFPTPA